MRSPKAHLKIIRARSDHFYFTIFEFVEFENKEILEILFLRIFFVGRFGDLMIKAITEGAS